MKETLHLTQEQKLQQRLSPQQVQFVRLLEMNRVEMEDEVRHEVLDNPAIQVSDNDESGQHDDFNESGNDNEDDGSANEIKPDPDMRDNDDDDDNDDIPAYRLNISNHSADDKAYEPVATSENSLIDYLTEQINEQDLTENQRKIADYIIGNIDSNGYLTRSVSAISDDLIFQTDLNVSEDEISTVLQMIRDLDPAGVGAVDLRDCLLLQLERLSGSAEASESDSDNGQRIHHRRYLHTKEVGTPMSNCMDVPTFRYLVNERLLVVLIVAAIVLKSEVLLPELDRRHSGASVLVVALQLLLALLELLDVIVVPTPQRFEARIVLLADDALPAVNIDGDDGVTLAHLAWLVRAASCIDDRDGRRLRVLNEPPESLPVERCEVEHGVLAAAGIVDGDVLDVERIEVDPELHAVVSNLVEGFKLLALSVRIHEPLLRHASLHDELRTLQKVLECLEHELCVRVVELLQLELHLVVEDLLEVAVRSHVGREPVDEHVACRLVVLDRSVVPHEEAGVPHADAVHGHEVLRGTAHAVLDVVVADEDWQRQTVPLNLRHRDHAVPPCRVRLVRVAERIYVASRLERLAADDVVHERHLHRRFDFLAVSAERHEPSILETEVGILHHHHCAADECVLVLVVDDAEQIVRADDGLGRDVDVIVHQQHVRRLRLLLHGNDNP